MPSSVTEDLLDPSWPVYLKSISKAKYFLLVLTPNALNRCDEPKDWVHTEIVAVFESNCKVIPIIDNFQCPLPETMLYFNGVRWVHDYQVRRLGGQTGQIYANFLSGDAYGKFDHIHGRRPQDGILTPSYTPRSASIIQPGATILSRNYNDGNGVQRSQCHIHTKGKEGTRAANALTRPIRKLTASGVFLRAVMDSAMLSELAEELYQNLGAVSPSPSCAQRSPSRSSLQQQQVQKRLLLRGSAGDVLPVRLVPSLLAPFPSERWFSAESLRFSI
ncbi:hypothetical protein DAPPUDRAFT_247970 [Daphnia pulex]|uniref:TIR domain-containing protein n=1 Tax=Daphnia pulex TaxID=6669 RepID=E9GTF9_DAPPU|nr:hypothetical protein DAPPUDRAFT_247970 [Daphnia pulex]|eukprot:EFX77225.1 hypothetical protein DAPPUDRAFT_247970 [Daphnia pulex]